MRDLFEHQPIPESDLAKINNSRFRKYLKYDGDHVITLEGKELEREIGHKSKIPNDMIHKIYVFPNGYGVSIIRGFHSNYRWELCVLEGCDTSITRDSITEHYLAHKGVAMGERMSDPRKYGHWKEVEEVLKLIKDQEG